MNTQPEALRLASALVRTDDIADHIRSEAAAELRRQHEELKATERQVEILSDELSKCSKSNAELLGAYRKMYNSAAGYSNYCEDSVNTRRCERDFEEADSLFRAAIAKHSKEQE